MRCGDQLADCRGRPGGMWPLRDGVSRTILPFTRKRRRRTPIRQRLGKPRVTYSVLSPIA